MNVNLARRLDYWLGIPICFFLSIINNLKKALSFRESKEISVKKIIFLEFSEIGSAILAYPAMQKAKEAYPEAELYFWIFKENEDGVRLLSLIKTDNIITMRSNNLLMLFLDITKNVYRLRKEKIDVAIDMELFSRFSSILSYLSGARIRVGFYKYTLEGLYRGNLHTHKVIYNSYTHISKNFISLVDSINVNSEDIPLLKKPQEERSYSLPKIKINQEQRIEIWERLKAINRNLKQNSRIIIIHLSFNDKLSIRKWPVEYCLTLIQKILKKDDTFVVLVGVDSSDRSYDFHKYERCIDLIGKTTAKDLIDLFNISQLLITHDSGMLHIASLTDIHIIALFGPETPLLYEPLTENKKIFYKNFSCSPCLSAYNHRRSMCNDNRCMQTIGIEEVYLVIKKYLFSA
jgi:ADP-heptose:LPS heptosyltransferase